MEALIRNTSANHYESLKVNSPGNDERLLLLVRYPHAKTNIKARILPVLSLFFHPFISLCHLFSFTLLLLR
jgi:hypothetical protein